MSSCPALAQQRAQLAVTLRERLGQIDQAVLNHALALLQTCDGDHGTDALALVLGPLWALGLQLPPPPPSRRERLLESIRLSSADDQTRASLAAQSRHCKLVRTIVERTIRNYVIMCWRFRLAATCTAD